MARRASALEAKRQRLTSSRLREAHRLSATALSRHDPVRPDDCSNAVAIAEAAELARDVLGPRSWLNRFRFNHDTGSPLNRSSVRLWPRGTGPSPCGSGLPQIRRRVPGLVLDRRRLSRLPRVAARPSGFVCPECGYDGGWRLVTDAHVRGVLAAHIGDGRHDLDRTRTPLTVWFSTCWSLRRRPRTGSPHSACSARSRSARIKRRGRC